MEWEFITPLIMMVVFTLTVGGVLLLRPIAKRLGDIVELMLREKRDGPRASCAGWVISWKT